MIRGNYSLAAEVRRNEARLQNKTQQRQKHKHQLEKLSNADPIRLYHNIERLKDEPSKATQKKLAALQADWDFIIKNKLHQEKVDSFLKRLKQDEAEKIRRDNTLWGQKSVYFNPELNPLGKVPKPTLFGECVRPLPNETVPVKKGTFQKYSGDPDIGLLGIVLPEGPPPRFYKKVQNAEQPEKAIEAQETSAVLVPTAFLAQKRRKRGSAEVGGKGPINAEESHQNMTNPYLGEEPESDESEEVYLQQSHLAPEEARYKKQRNS